MKAKKPAVKTAPKSEKVSAKKSGKKSVTKPAEESVKKQKSGVKKYCEACMNIRNGITNSPATSQGNFVPHTCGKTEQQLREFTYNMRILNSIRKRLKSGGGYDDY